MMPQGEPTQLIVEKVAEIRIIEYTKNRHSWRQQNEYTELLNNSILYRPLRFYLTLVIHLVRLGYYFIYIPLFQTLNG